MDMTDKTAQPSMEEILASIRKLLSEEGEPRPEAIDFNARPIMLNDDDEEETSEFDLPAIFRSSTAPVERVRSERSSASLVRLTDAIRSVTAGMATVSSVAYEAEVQQRPADEPLKGLSSLRVEETVRVEATLASVQQRELQLTGAAGPLDDTSFFEGSPHMAPPRADLVAEQRPTQTPAPASAPVKASSEPGDVRRVMAPFKDTKFKALSSPADTPAPAPAPVAESRPAPAPSVAEPKLPMPPADAFDVKREPVLPSFPPPRREAKNGLAPSFQQAALTHREEAPQANGIEEAAADLLRPMLRSWLAENMPKMVEKALVLEMNQQLANIKKSGGSEG